VQLAVQKQQVVSELLTTIRRRNDEHCVKTSLAGPEESEGNSSGDPWREERLQGSPSTFQF
jgi:hypothetical protein